MDIIKKEKLKNKKVIIVIITSVITVVSMIIIMTILNQSKLKLKAPEFFTEYGQAVSKNLENYLDLNDLNESQKQEVLKSAKLELPITNEVGKAYPDIGTYKGSIVLDKERLTFKIIVKDTVSPQFLNFVEKIEVGKNEKFDYEKFFTVKDMSHVRLIWNDQNVNYEKTGEYKATIKAIDDSQNETTKEITIKVVEVDINEYVPVKNYISNIYIDLRYASSNNFTKKVIYDFQEAYLRYGTIQKLKKVQDELWTYGYSLKIWDAYRPMEAQRKLWDVVNNPRYVANPKKPIGHNLGGTVDITLVKRDGQEIPMPTEFDDFSLKADRNYDDIQSAEAIQNVKLLEKVMRKYGFKGYKNEWWDYSDTHSYTFTDFCPNK